MKKVITRFGTVLLLIISLLFGSLIPSTSVLANNSTPFFGSIIDQIFGNIPGNDNDDEKLSQEEIDSILGNNKNEDDEKLSQEEIDSILGNSGNNEDDEKLSQEEIDSILGNDKDEEDEKLSQEEIDSILGNEGNNEDDEKLSQEEIDSILGISSSVNTCQDEVKGASWVICTAFEVAAGASDTVYNLIEGFLVIEPLSTDTESATYRVWDYMRGITNIVFVIFLVIVIYSQITGLGINNYGIKRVLPRLIIAVIIVNLSYIICAGLVDLSNIIGSGISGVFDRIITETGLNNIAENELLGVDWGQIYLALTSGGAALALFTVASGGFGSVFWLAILLLIGGIFSLISGLITIGLRQVVVTILVLISPLAFVAYLLPNTEKWFSKWKSLLAQMLVFYPVFAFLFSASKLAGLTIIGSSGGSMVKVVIGLAVQILPLFMSLSLLKMSGTVLGKVSSAIDRASSHVAKPLQGWALSHREQNKQRYLAHNYAPGAKLRNFLARRQVLREMNTTDNQERVINRATEAALNKRASYLGIGEDGKPIWGKRIGPVTLRNNANRFTKDATRASVQKLSTAAAQTRLTNSLGEHGSLFYTRSAGAISDSAASAFKEMMIQEFWKENIAQSDQEYLIQQYLGAIDMSKPNAVYNYNRLIASAAGSLGYKGEKTIIGQVVKRSVEIETRRRAEAAVVINKFGYTKEFRNMMFDRRYMNDDGFALDEKGEVVEDINYRPLEGKEIEKWHKYIYVDKRNRELDRQKCDNMSEEERERKGIKKVRYCDITDDKGNVVTHVYDDDAGYVKEMIMNDMLISDPIALRYATEIGLMRSESDLANDPLSAQYADKNRQNGEGVIRRYRTSVVGALQSSGFKEHMAEMTSLLLAQINNGYVNSPEQMNLARIMSFIRSSKVGAFLQNDNFFYNFWSRILPVANDPEKLAEFFPDSEIALYRDQNGLPLDGVRLAYNDQGEAYWKDISHTSSDITIDDKRNYIIHKAIPKAAAKIIGSLDRRVSNNALDSMKPENMKALIKAFEAAGSVGLQNSDPTIPFEKRANGTMNLFEDNDPNQFKQRVDELRRHSEALRSGINPETASSQEKFLRSFKKRLRNNSPVQARQDIEEIILNDDFSLDSTCALLHSYCNQSPVLNIFSSEIDDMIERYLYGGEIGDNEADIARNIASDHYTREQLLDEFRNRFL